MFFGTFRYLRRDGSFEINSDAFMISVLIVTHNNAGDIRPCLDSLLREPDPIQILVMDNRSSDRTRDAVRAFMRANPGREVRMTANATNGGYAAAVNQGLKRARGEWICILGPDTRIHAGTLQTLRKKLELHPDAAIAAPQLLRPDGSVQPSCRRFPRVRDALLELSGLPRLFSRTWASQWKMPDFDHRSERFVDQPEATCLLVRRTAVESVGGMDERFPIFFNDVDWCRRFRMTGWRILFTPDAKVIHLRGTSVSVRPAPMIWKSHQGFYRYFRKYPATRLQKSLLPCFGMLLIWTASLRSAAAAAGIRRAGLREPK